MKSQKGICCQPSRLSLEIESAMPTEPTLPFAQQFNYHLKDVPLTNFEPKLDATGEVIVHLPDITSLSVPFNPMMTVMQFRDELEFFLPSGNYHPIDNYYLVTRNGIIEDGETLGGAYVKEGTHLLLISKGVSRSDVLKKRDYWVRRREKRTAVTCVLARSAREEKTPEQLVEIRRALSQRSRFGSKYSFKRF